MRIKLIYPTWQRIQYQTQYVLPPLGVSIVAALTPAEHHVTITDENVEKIDFDEPVDLVGISTLLVSQSSRAFQIADEYRRRGVPVVMGGLTVSSIPDKAREHADAIVYGEAEGVWPEVVRDVENKQLKPYYSRNGFCDAREIPVPRRELLTGDYTYRGIRMMDLVETSRGCRFGCFPCQVPYIAGKSHRQRDIVKVVDEIAAIDNDRVFIVDNAMEQNEEHQRAFFKELVRANKAWVAHPISAKPDILEVAAESGCWFVYQAIWDTSDRMRQKIKMMHDFGIAVEGTILLGTDEHGPDIFKKMCDFLLECELDLAEFTVVTPFPGTEFYNKMKSAGRILHEDYAHFNAEEVVIKPAKMTPQQLQDGYLSMWDTFYKGESQAAKMAKLYHRLRTRRGWKPRVGTPETRAIPNQRPGTSALWGGVVEAAKVGERVRNGRDNKDPS